MKQLRRSCLSSILGTVLILSLGACGDGDKPAGTTP